MGGLIPAYVGMFRQGHQISELKRKNDSLERTAAVLAHTVQALKAQVEASGARSASSNAVDQEELGNLRQNADHMRN